MSRATKNIECQKGRSLKIEYRILNWIHSTFSIRYSIFNQRAFTLIELMVSVSIMVILTTVMFANYPESIVRVGLSNANHKISLLVREAQVKSSAVDSRSNSVSGYGVYAVKSDTSNLILFSDFSAGGVTDDKTGILLGNGIYNSSSVSDEKVSTLKLQQGFSISKLCVKPGTDTSWDCLSGSTDTLTISFTRPNPRPHIYKNSLTPSSPTIGTDYDEACIEIQAMNPTVPGHTRSVKVNNTGFITTSNNGCTP